MDSTWQEVTIGEVVEFFDHKRVPVSSRERQTRQGSYPYYGASGIIDYVNEFLFDGRFLLIAEDGENLNSRKLPVAFFASGKFWVNNHAHVVRAIREKADDYFLKAWFDQADISGYITGAAQPKLSQENLRRIKLWLPSLPTQCKIAAILSTYDDLIEVNTRRIAILEEMARGLYREWFVRFRYPGHEGGRMVESAAGLIPEGWEVVRMGDVCSIVMGQSPSSEFYNESGQGLPFHQGVTDFGHLFPKDRVFCTAENRIANEGDILLSVRAPVGRINIANKKIVIGRGLSAIRSRAGYQVLAYFQLKNIFQEEDIMGSGTIFKAVTKDDVHGIKLLWPPEPMIADFERVASPILSSLGNLTAKNANLRRTRDLLLPRLVAGIVNPTASG